MITRTTELFALLLVLGTLVGVPYWVARTEAAYTAPPAGENMHVLTLTAVADGGIWTEDEVVGHSYWRRQPTPARPVVHVGETVVIRLKSADVSHSFSIPELEVGPIPVEPGHVSEARFVPAEPGEYLTQCSTRCGDCHEEMLGTIVVLGPGEVLANYPGGMLPPRTKCPHHSEEKR